MKAVLKRFSAHIREKQYTYVCVMITLGLLALGLFRFPNALGRLVEAFRDLGLSIAYVFCDAFDIEPSFILTVNSYPDYSFLNIKEWFFSLFDKTNTPSIPSIPSLPSTPSTPSAPIPSDWEVFKIKWSAYWTAFVDVNNLLLYVYYILYYVTWILSFLMYAIPLWICTKKLFSKYYFSEDRKTETNEEESSSTALKESKALRLWHRLYFNVIVRIALWFLGLVEHIKEREELYQFWLLLALLYFNVLTIVIEFIAFYLYFSVSFDFVNLYRQVYKLFLDLNAFFTFMPFLGYIVLGFVLLDKYSKKVGYNRLEHNERKNRGFINDLGIVTYIYAEMGEGKTTMLTSMGLSNEVQLRDDALEVILECDMCFPNFPWLSLERVLKNAYENHEIYDKWSCIRFIQKLRDQFLESPCSENIFGYDIEKYPLTFDNKLYVEDIWQTIEDYALAYTIYTIESSLIISNYSIRVDSLMIDLGNFPVWDCDFFKRDSRLIDSFSRHSHILDYDMVRLGNQMIKDNPNRYAFGWGVWVYTELDKEAKNTLELQEVKANDDECNQKNDLMHVLFKMSRHACMIRHRNFIRIIADMQRVENITANLRQIGQVALIAEKGDKGVVLPWYSPYKLFAPALLSLKSAIDNIYVNDRFLRSDKRLIVSGLEKSRSIVGNWDKRTENLFGCRVLEIELQTGRMNGKVKQAKYYIQDKKDYAKRNGSDCMAGVFESRGELNTIGLDDMAEYADYIATQDELLKQNSYLQKELKEFKGGHNMAKTDIKEVDKLLSSTVAGLMAMQNGKIQAGAETKKAAQVLVQSLCGVVSEWAEEKENADKSA